MPGFFANPWLQVIAGTAVFGALCTLSLDPFLVPGVVWICTWPMFYFAERFQSRLWVLAGIGALGSFFLCLFSFYWMLHLMGTFGGLNIALSLLIFVPYTVLLNLKIPFFMAAFGYAIRHRHRLPPLWFIAGMLGLLTDYLSPQVFPWYWGNLLAKNRPLAQVAEYTGIYGISFLHFAGTYGLFEFAGAAFRIWRSGTPPGNALALALKSGSWSGGRMPLVLPTLFAFVTIFGYFRLAFIAEMERNLPHVRVAMIQPNTRLPHASEGRVPDSVVQELFANTIPRLVRKAQEAGPLDMIVLPESGVPNNLTTQDHPVTRWAGIYSPEYAELVKRLALENGATVFVNEVAGDVRLDRLTRRPRPIYFNSSVAFSPDGVRREFYHKRTLLAFGEYIPGAEFLDQTGLIALVPEAIRYSRFERGESAHNVTYYKKPETGKLKETGAVPAGTFLPLICYEVLIPEYIRSFFQDSNPGFMVNITQDGWYGKTVETFQHFGLGRIRAIETRRALVRSTNSGSSGFVNLSGDYVQPDLGPRLSGQEVEDVQVWQVPVNTADPTLYVRFGNAWILILTLLGGIWCMFEIRRARSQGREA